MFLGMVLVLPEPKNIFFLLDYLSPASTLLNSRFSLDQLYSMAGIRGTRHVPNEDFFLKNLFEPYSNKNRIFNLLLLFQIMLYAPEPHLKHPFTMTLTRAKRWKRISSRYWSTSHIEMTQIKQSME